MFSFANLGTLQLSFTTRKSTISLSLPFFLGTQFIGDTQCGFSLTSEIAPIRRRLFISLSINDVYLSATELFNSNEFGTRENGI